MPTSTQNITIKALRIQYRVGHGGFHATITTSDDGSFAYVYDIGASPRKSRAIAAIDSFIRELKKRDIATVDYIILSHIDEDHVNTFSELVDQLHAAHISCPTVMLPWLEPTEKLFALSHANIRHPGSTASRLAGNKSSIVEYFNELDVTDVVFVRAPDSSADDEAPVGARFVTAGTNLATNFSVPWILILTRIQPRHQVLTSFQNSITKATGLDPDDPGDRMTLVKKHRRLIRRAMRTVARGANLSGYGPSLTNWSSLSIFGSSAYPRSTHSVPAVSATGDLRMECDHGWLHTGDLPLDISPVWNEFSSIWRKSFPSGKLCALAAPHHGSPHGHNSSLFSAMHPESVLYMTGWTSGSAIAGTPMYAKRINPSASKADASAAGSTIIELNNP